MNYTNRALKRHLRVRRFKSLIRRNWFVFSEALLFGFTLGMFYVLWFIARSQI